MGQVTSTAQVWTPDANDLNEPDVYLATMAASIENGLGARMTLQEIAVGLKGSLADNAMSLSSTPTVVPYAVAASSTDFNNGFSFSGGVATVQTKGMYIVTASVGAQSGSGTGLKIQLYQNTINFATAENPQNSVVWVSAAGSAVVNCVPGDTLYAKASITALTGTQANRQPATNYLSIALVQALPA